MTDPPPRSSPSRCPNRGAVRPRSRCSRAPPVTAGGRDRGRERSGASAPDKRGGTAGPTPRPCIRDEAFRVDIERTLKLYDSINKRLQEVDLIRDVGGYNERAPQPNEASGRGLQIVQQLATEWGVLPSADGHGKTVIVEHWERGRWVLWERLDPNGLPA